MLDETLTRRFDRPHNHNEEAMKAEFAELPGTWRIYGTDSFPTGNRYHVEFRVTDGDRAALLAALEKIAKAV